MNWKSLFCTDFLMDCAQLLAVQCAFSHVHIRRLAGSALLMLVCTMAAALFNPAAPVLAAATAVLYVLTARILLGKCSLRRTMEAAASLFCTGAAAAGFARMGNHSLPARGLWGIMLVFFLLRGRWNSRCCWNIELYLELDGLCASFPALIDTGNRLREAVSGLPVVIVEAPAAPAIARHAVTMDPARFRTLPYGVLGGGGRLLCFRPDRLEFEARGHPRRIAPDCWVALYSGRIPGSTRALAPPEFTQYTRRTRSTPERCPDLPRRFNYGIFKH